MKTRILAAAFLVPALFLLVLVLPKGFAAVVMGVLQAIASYELLYRTGLVTETRLVVYACAMSFLVTMWSYMGAVHAIGLLGLLVFMAVMYAEMMMSHVKITFDKICMCMMGGVLIPLLLSSLIRILMLRIGRYMVLVPFIVAFGSDSGAYFAGRFFGSRKLAPVISQHKTVEGAIGGVVFAIVCMIVYSLILQLAFDFRINYLYAILYGLVGSVAGVFGDLCFSVVKRQTGIKDYGNLIPGHGGVLDRFDSMMMVGPLMEAMMIILPMAV